ncbi:uncharacterized protein G2W53_024321 [Senna tora]|uniref:Uncharacterized protein n=1 Tax=Senna tora TaxID=362788 RepID=A0A834TCY5_9FABA|nr:uncharacterized protein G2W53_024321 [Senna tora]
MKKRSGKANLTMTKILRLEKPAPRRKLSINYDVEAKSIIYDDGEEKAEEWPWPSP